MGSIGGHNLFSPREVDRLRAFLADKSRRYGSLLLLANAMGRKPEAIQSKLAELKRQPRMNFNVPGVMIDDWGLSHATIIAEMREGTR